MKLGDLVHVHIAQDQVLIEGIVRHMPQATGDSWVIDGTDGLEYYVQTFEYINTVRKP